MYKIAQEQESRLFSTKPLFYSWLFSGVPLPLCLALLFSFDLASILTYLLCTIPTSLAPLPMLDLYAPSFVLDDETFPALVPQDSYMNAGVHLRGRHRSCSGSSTFIYICHCSSVRSEPVLFSLLNDHTYLSSFVFEDSILPPLFRREFINLCHRPSSRTELFLAWFLDLDMCATFILEDQILPALVPPPIHMFNVHHRGRNPSFPSSSTLLNRTFEACFSYFTQSKTGSPRAPIIIVGLLGLSLVGLYSTPMGLCHAGSLSMVLGI